MKNFKSDFGTVDLILESSYETRGVDAFALSIIKTEKQIRRVFTYLIFQNPTYSIKDYNELRRTLASNTKIYFTGFISGIDLILPQSLKHIYGENYENDIQKVVEFTKERNKIFHGQITKDGLTRDDLISRVEHLKVWCENISEKLIVEIGYDGFSDSYKKSSLDLKLKNLDKFDTIEKYSGFLKKEVQRNPI